MPSLGLCLSIFRVTHPRPRGHNRVSQSWRSRQRHATSGALTVAALAASLPRAAHPRGTGRSLNYFAIGGE